MKSVFIIAKMSILENFRKHIFHVLCLLMLAVIAGSTMLSIYTEGVKIKMLKDLCMTTILFGGALLSITLSASGIPQDVETRTIYPIIARPITRFQYLLGKYLGTVITSSIGILGMAAIFGALIYFNQKSIDSFLILAVIFTIFEAALLAAITTTISTFSSPPIASISAFLIYIIGSIKISYLFGLIANNTNPISKFFGRVIYHILPNIECFNLKTALIHNEAVPTTYLLQVAFYGLLYSTAIFTFAVISLKRKEI